MEKIKYVFYTSIPILLILLTIATSATNYHTVLAQNNTHTVIISNQAGNDKNILLSNDTLNLSNSSIPLHKENVIYYKNTSGYLVYPESEDIQNNLSAANLLPSVVMIHEWWGLNYNIKNMADELAKNGYAVLAVDLYNGKVASTPEEAMKLVNMVREDQNESNLNMLAAVNYLKTLNNVDQSKIASLGWCFGGGQSLQLALNTSSNSPLAATVLYYGNLVTDQQILSKIKWPVLGIFGSLDKSIPVSEVKKFDDALNANNIPNEIYIYEGVGHAFANPTGESFTPAELKDAWEKTIAFLDKNLKGTG